MPDFLLLSISKMEKHKENVTKDRLSHFPARMWHSHNYPSYKTYVNLHWERTNTKVESLLHDCVTNIQSLATFTLYHIYDVSACGMVWNFVWIIIHRFFSIACWWPCRKAIICNMIISVFSFHFKVSFETILFSGIISNQFLLTNKC